MDLDDFLNIADRTAANLAKLQEVWRRAEEYIPGGPALGRPPEYEDLCRAWTDLLPGLPPIDGWTVSTQLPDIDALGRAYLEYAEIGERPSSLLGEAEAPGKALAEYGHRLRRARRRAVHKRVEELITFVDSSLPRLLCGVPRDCQDLLTGPLCAEINDAFDEMQRLMADAPRSASRWSDLARHRRFGQGHDWHDIAEFDWPDVRRDVEVAGVLDDDPLPVPNVDLGAVASGQLPGVASSALPWNRLDPDGFERLLYDLLRDLPQHQNVQWLQRTTAADRGRDLSCERVTANGAGDIRTERVVVQAKHWQSQSVGLSDMSAVVSQMALLTPPLVRVLIVATSGAFTLDGIEWAERHNNKGIAPCVELWPHSRLEALLAARPQIAAAHGLR